MGNETLAVQKLWNYCNVLRDDGVSYGDYVEQLTYLLFLKMDDEQTKPPFNRETKIPNGLNWESLLKKDGDELEVHYRHILESLGKEKGIIGVIFRKAQNKIQDPAKLKRLVMLIEGEETWMGMGIDVKGAIYEGLLQKNAEDIKSGAGQYFTPRALIKAMVEVIRPKPGETICDPACGTGGFLLASHDLISKYPLNIEQKQFLKEGTFHGWDIVDSVVRLCTMNLYLHGIGGEESPIITDDALASDPGSRFDIVLTNPPFGKKSSITIVNGEGKIEKESLTYQRNDFWATTSNKQLNFLQHVKTLLKINGRAAIVVPDNVLFEGGAGETVRKRLLQQCEVHTLLRLPTGIFYAQGVKANVLFFDKRPASEKPWTEKLWIYDLRTNIHFTLKTNTLQYEDLKDFIECYNPENRYERKETERFKVFTYEDIIKRDKTNLDIFWLKDESLGDLENLPDPKILALEIADSLESALEEFKRIYEVLEE
ncbi:MAG: SAM-dependent DNA methyltransferase [Candidatus Methanofastidiosa archaeon]|jgi:type I restriction enzyme M protein|nr:SAM-dependent DNA methyltransferase [Candidatus Methanofastidiosa archaeon]HOM95856.1 class I SAM-dependent DNA methyltransferase [Methanofastidiosum sp.]HPC80970.1 class I SAM-dependent DNA methyltransferase [Methanofastidiosum sp.]HRS25523.1 class I SAM-dependent DNA methyltransferase [Methanofastidiosum sp.]